MKEGNDKVFDKSVANALANAEIDTNILKAIRHIQYGES